MGTMICKLALQTFQGLGTLPLYQTQILQNCLLQAMRSCQAHAEQMRSTNTFTAINYHGIRLKTHRLEVLEENRTGTFIS